MKTDKSSKAFQAAKKVIPGGVNSPARAFNAVEGDPLFIQSAKGSKITDIDGNTYTDYVCSWGPLILGHDNPVVRTAVGKALKNGASFGAPTTLETELARLVVKMIPSAEKVRFVNSGTEAAMSALRLARGFTGRDAIVKFKGSYHGHHDCLLVAAGSGALTHGKPDSAGVLKDFVRHTYLAEFNDLEAVKKLFAKNGRKIAAVILEPVVGNSGVISPENGFLEGLRKLTQKHESLLVFDEVMTGFRLSSGGAQKRFNVKPDITVLGKIIGGGLPVGAYAGPAEIMDHMAPDGPVYQAGTLSGNPLAMAAGIATLSQMKKAGVYSRLEKTTSDLCDGLSVVLNTFRIPNVINQAGSMFTVFFTEQKSVKNSADAQKSDTKRFAAFHRAMLSQGVYFPCSQFESAFVSLAHSKKDITETIRAAKKALEKMNIKT